MALKKILELANEVEAQLLDAALAERGIPHVIRRRGEPGIGGFFQTELGWGYLEAEPESKKEILEIHADLSSGPPSGAGEQE